MEAAAQNELDRLVSEQEHPFTPAALLKNDGRWHYSNALKGQAQARKPRLRL